MVAPEHGAMYLLSAASLFLYQKFVLGSAGASYVLIAPILPVVITLLLTKPKKNPGNRSGAVDSPAE